MPPRHVLKTVRQTEGLPSALNVVSVLPQTRQVKKTDDRQRDRHTHVYENRFSHSTFKTKTRTLLWPGVVIFLHIPISPPVDTRLIAYDTKSRRLKVQSHYHSHLSHLYEPSSSTPSVSLLQVRFLPHPSWVWFI